MSPQALETIATNSSGAKIIVVNAKGTDLCDRADLWMQPRPGTDVMLFNAMARVTAPSRPRMFSPTPPPTPT